jgi:hypothetical protein
MFQWLKDFFWPPHVCKRFHWLLKEGIKQCDQCGKRYYIKDGKPVKPPKPYHLDYD